MTIATVGVVVLTIGIAMMPRVIVENGERVEVANTLATAALIALGFLVLGTFGIAPGVIGGGLGAASALYFLD